MNMPPQQHEEDQQGHWADTMSQHPGEPGATTTEGTPVDVPKALASTAAAMRRKKGPAFMVEAQESPG